MQFDLSIFAIILLVYGIVRSTLFFKKTGNFIYIVAIAIFLLVISNSWIETYGGRIGEMYRSYSAIFNVIPLGIFFVYIYLENMRKKEREEKERTRTFFGKYVSEKVIDKLMAEKEISVGGRRQEVTVLFTDVRGFTSLSERLPPEEVVRSLNEHFNILTEIAFKHGGTVDKFIGDAVMVIFGAPVFHKDHALRAVQCGIEMQEKMAGLNEQLRKRGRPEVPIGVSINTGDAIIGNIGSDKFMDYTAVGDTVNTASRLQSAAGAGEVAISESTYQAVRKEVSIIKKEKMSVKGKKIPLVVYKVKV